ncbi:MAG: T9SS C-terminal target domain-containing protein, partial [Bacteroidetes bacterium]
TEAASVQLEVRDLLGRLVDQQSLPAASGLQGRDISLDLPAGTYLLSLRSGDQLWSQRVIVK